MIWKLRILGELQPCWWIWCTGRSACATQSGGAARLRRRALQRRGGMGVEDFGGMASPAGGSDAQAGVPVPRGADGPPQKAGPTTAGRDGWRILGNGKPCWWIGCTAGVPVPRGADGPPRRRGTAVRRGWLRRVRRLGGGRRRGRRFCRRSGGGAGGRRCARDLWG